MIALLCFLVALFASPFKSKCRLEAENAALRHRRECVDHLVFFGEAHLPRILTRYAAYYNELRTHRSLKKDAPIHRAVQHVGRIVHAPVLGGLHHQYCRI